jgi:hypothetical protein
MERENKRHQAVYTIIPRSEGKDFWLRIGHAFENRDGSTTVLLDAMPTNGKLQIRDITAPEERRERAAAGR